ncbi:MAG: HsdR family type I site-specific deoxyribonuclease [Elusimicrobia bacterium]|nr:HsdR family type I site-specific deoxyribonuclease [Elusimicrobiota bacterium]
MTPGLGSERGAVQNPLISYAEEIGWSYLSPDEALNLRRGAGGWLLYPVLHEKLIVLNPGVVDDKNADALIARIESVRCSIEGNFEILKWLRGEHSVHSEDDKRRRNVATVDFDHPANNVFHVTDEWEYTNGQKGNRPDIVFLINGIPVAIAETKSAKYADGIDRAVVQLRRYHEETPELMAAPQVFEATQLLDFYYGVTWNLERKNIFNWKEEEPGNFEAKVKRFFSRERFLKLLQDWIIFFTKDDELRKIILRQHQTRAVEKIVERALDPVKKTGLIWHTQGSGKTFTMITAARRLLENEAFGKPTVLMLVDRNELEGQLSGWITSVLGEGKAEVVQNKKHLRDILRSDYRGLIVSMIHKFEKTDKELCTRDNVFVLVDEAHRSTSGDLGNYLQAALPKATFLGFTGTPIDRIAYGKGTFKVFGKDDPQGYLDKYSIKESIEDGTTLELHYALAPNEIRVPGDMLEKEFFALAETEGISDIEELNRILDRAVTLKAFLKSKDRVHKVAQFVAEHFKTTVEPLGYKAFLVGVDREACALYKKELDRLLPESYSRVVYTSQHNDSPTIAKFKLKEDEEKRVRKAFTKPGENPKILIVTEKLLTGFDAPILYCMYLDKPMRDHALLQAIARVNRPFESEGIKKPAGFVLDFVGIFERLEKALSFDSDVVQSVIKNLDVLKTRFVQMMKEESQPYLVFCRGRMDDKAVERAVEALADKAKRDKFFEFFKALENLYEIISPDPMLRDFMDDYARLCRLYQVIRAAVSPRRGLYLDLMKKTEGIVRERAEALGLCAITHTVKINEATLDALKKKQAPPAAKVMNLARILEELVRTQGDRQPFLIPIGERVETIVKNYDDRQLTTEQALQELEKLLKEYEGAKRRADKSGLSPEAFAVFWLLDRAGAAQAEAVARQTDVLFAERFPHFADNAADLRQLKAELYKLLRPVVGIERMKTMADQIQKVYET